jgi:hypothetical protein
MATNNSDLEVGVVYKFRNKGEPDLPYNYGKLISKDGYYLVFATNEYDIDSRDITEVEKVPVKVETLFNVLKDGKILKNQMICIEEGKSYVFGQTNLTEDENFNDKSKFFNKGKPIEIVKITYPFNYEKKDFSERPDRNPIIETDNEELNDHLIYSRYMLFIHIDTNKNKSGGRKLKKSIRCMSKNKKGKRCKNNTTKGRKCNCHKRK